jgi:tripartite-type tricarboxylate transporter receptor subunit TctC
MMRVDERTGRTRVRPTAVITTALLVVAAILAPGTVAAQAIQGPVTIVVSSEPGAAPDVLARILSGPLSERLGQPVVVENRPGAGGNIGALAVAKARPDGRTLFMATVNMTISPWMTKAAPFDPAGDFTAVGQVASVPMVVVVHPRLGPKTMKELVELAKSKPGSLNYSSPGIGSLNHLETVLFERAAGIRLVHVPYKSGAASTTAVLGEEVQLFFAGMPPAVPHIRTGALLGLSVTADARSPLIPAVPTLAEAGYPDLESDAWYAILGPKNLPAALVTRLNVVLNEVLALPSVTTQFANSGAAIRSGTPEAMTRLLAGDSKRYRGVVEELGLAK